MTRSHQNILLRFAPMIYGPTVLFALGEGAVVPLIPVIAGELGANLASSGLIAGTLVIGQLCGNIPAGVLVARTGERVAMVVAALLALIGVAGLLLASSIPMLTAAVFVIGMCAATFGLARHSFMTTRVPIAFRARALALLGGSFRLGMFVGPFLAALLLGITGDEHSAVWAFGVCLLACVALVWFGPDPETQVNDEVGDAVEPTDAVEAADTGEPVTSDITLPGRQGVFRTMITHRGVLFRLGTAAASLSAIRSARQVVLPLWGVSLGLDAQTIALVVGISGALDFTLFYASGQVMDRFGRLWAALPAMLLMGAGFVALAFTHDLPEAAMWFAMFAAVLGVGNGLSSGVNMTLGADSAPKGQDPAAYLGSWRTFTDAGGAAAPLIFAGVAAVSTLAVATGAMGAIGLLGAVGFMRWVPRYVPRSHGGDA